MKTCSEPCAVERGMRLLGGKWRGTILWQLRDEPLRFNELSRRVSGASKRMIAQRLAEMEADGLLERKVLSKKPMSVQYELTTRGRSALVYLKDIQEWAENLDRANA